ncbi:hypothetical protein [Bacillus pumilus]|uniref:hypothetical protein n=1 Tax=Bacillus pumilus TaxID=1408 RepID=UPI0011E8F653|nr:hypothetical protein [Bacillus pumilus]TYS33019.1 hypothetical protein FZC65_06530 [Bacillus pumilus]TYS50722.1 hypothetical protein FZC67_05105 [Bacillus pumilus]
MGQAQKMSEEIMVRFEFVDLANTVTIKTFNKEIYVLKSSLFVQNVHNNRILRFHEIYYDIRTVRTIKGKVLAKRKNRNSELVKFGR